MFDLWLGTTAVSRAAEEGSGGQVGGAGPGHPGGMQKEQAVSKALLVPRYELANEPPGGFRPAGGFKYIYVLLFNLDGLTQKPFYVGQTDDLSSRFANHQMIMWHWAKFGRRCRVYIAGWVPADAATEAEMDLIQRLTYARYMLTNRVTGTRTANRKQSGFRIIELPRANVEDYLRYGYHDGLVLKEWRAVWGNDLNVWGRGLNPRKASREAIIAYVDGLAYPTPEARVVSTAIAAAYNPLFRFAEFNLKAPGGNLPEESIRILKAFDRADLRTLQHVWLFPRNAHTGLKRFRFTRGHEEKLIRHLTLGS